MPVRQIPEDGISPLTCRERSVVSQYLLLAARLVYPTGQRRLKTETPIPMPRGRRACCWVNWMGLAFDHFQIPQAADS